MGKAISEKFTKAGSKGDDKRMTKCLRKLRLIGVGQNEETGRWCAFLEFADGSRAVNVEDYTQAEAVARTHYWAKHLADNGAKVGNVIQVDNIGECVGSA